MDIVTKIFVSGCLVGMGIGSVIPALIYGRADVIFVNVIFLLVGLAWFGNLIKNRLVIGYERFETKTSQDSESK